MEVCIQRVAEKQYMLLFRVHVIVVVIHVFG